MQTTSCLHTYIKCDMSAVPKNVLLTHVHNKFYVIIRYAITSNVKNI